MTNTPISQNPDPNNTNNPTDAQPQRLSIDTPEDMLAYIMHVLGFNPTNSLVAVARRDMSLGAVMRCDLAPGLEKLLSEADQFLGDLGTELNEFQYNLLTRYGRQIALALSHDSEADSTMLVVYLDELHTQEATALTILQKVCTIISQPLLEAGLEPAEIWLICQNKMWHLTCEDPECDVYAQPIGDPSASGIMPLLQAHGYTLFNPPQNQQLPLPAELEIDPLQIHRAHQDPTIRTEKEISEFIRWVDLVESYLKVGQHVPPLTDQHIKQLLEGFQDNWRRDLVLAMAVLGKKRALEGTLALGALPHKIGKKMGITPDSRSGVACREFIIGRSEGYPDWHRIGQLYRLAWVLMPVSTGTATAALAALVIWIEWSRGRGSVAAIFAEQILAHASGYAFLELMQSVICKGVVCPWATQPATAWSAKSA